MKLQRKYKQEIVKPKGSNNHNTDKPDISLDKPKQENTMLTILFSVNICNTSQVKNLKTPDDNRSFSFFHFNTCSLSKNFDDFQLLF